MCIGGEHRFPASEGADEHQQRGLGEMKVCQKTAHNLKFVTGTYKNTCLPGVRLQGISLSGRRAMFQRPRRSCAGSNNAIPRLQRGVYRFGGDSGESVVFGVEMDVLHVFRANWLEGAQADMKCNRLNSNSYISDFLENRPG